MKINELWVIHSSSKTKTKTKTKKKRLGFGMNHFCVLWKGCKYSSIHACQKASSDQVVHEPLLPALERLQVQPHSHIHDLQPRSTTSQQSWSIMVSRQ